MISALPAFKCIVSSLSAFIFLGQAPASAECPLLSYMLLRIPLLSLPQRSVPFHLHPQTLSGCLGLSPKLFCVISIRVLTPFRLLEVQVFLIFISISISWSPGSPALSYCAQLPRQHRQSLQVEGSTSHNGC